MDCGEAGESQSQHSTESSRLLRLQSQVAVAEGDVQEPGRSRDYLPQNFNTMEPKETESPSKPASLGHGEKMCFGKDAPSLHVWGLSELNRTCEFLCADFSESLRCC